MLAEIWSHCDNATKKLLQRVQVYLMLRRANKLIRVKRNKNGMKVVDWVPANTDKVGILILSATSFVIICNLIFYMVQI